MVIDENLLQFATPVQAECIQAVNQHGTQKAAAAALGRNQRSLERALKNVRKTAAQQGYAPDNDLNHIQPPGQVVKGISTAYNSKGDISLQWVKTEQEKENHYKILIQSIEDACSGLPKFKKIKAPARNYSNLCSLYTLTDFHLGMLAWEDETGADWDVNIAEKVLMNAFSDLSHNTPESESAILNIMGDFLHFDSLSAITPASGHLLDSDTRFAKLVDLSLTLVIRLVHLLLEKHKKVYVKILEGNHDPASSVWIRMAIKKMFESNKRVQVDDSPLPFYAHQHGKVMLGLHHGHKVKNKSLSALFASEPRFRKMWGECEYTYIHSGHYHHTEQEISECGGAIVERHPTLAARDAYAARGGYVSIRGAKSITYDKQVGEMYRSTVVPRQNQNRT